MPYVIRIRDGARYRDLEQAFHSTDIDAVDWFNAYPMQRHPTLLRQGRRIICKRRAND